MVDVCVTAPALARGGDVPGSVALRPGGAAANVAVWARAAAAGTLLANAAEATALTGVTDPELAAGALAGLVPVVVVKLGPAGVVVAAGERLHALGAEPAAAADPTGAGDALAAGYLVARAGGAGPVEAARAGIRLAARAVAVEGAWPPPGQQGDPG